MPKLGTDLLLLMKEGFNPDLAVICEGGNELMVHRFILAARSVVFKGMMEADMKETRTGRVEIRDVDPEVVSEFVNYMYSDEIGDDFSRLAELLMVGHKYQVASLIEECSKRLVEAVSVNNVAQLWSLTESYDLVELSDRCVEFTSENFEKMDPSVFDSIPSSLLRKVMSTNKRNFKTQYMVSFNDRKRDMVSLNDRKREAVIVEENVSLATNFQVSRCVNLTGVGVYTAADHVPVEISVFYDCDSENHMTTMTTTDITSQGWSKPTKIMFPAPICLTPDYPYMIVMEMKDSCVIYQTKKPFEDRKVVSTAMNNGDLIVKNVSDLAEVPILYFEE